MLQEMIKGFIIVPTRASRGYRTGSSRPSHDDVRLIASRTSYQRYKTQIVRIGFIRRNLQPQLEKTAPLALIVDSGISFFGINFCVLRQVRGSLSLS